MLFNSFIFLFAFLPVTYFVFWRLRSVKARHFWLAVTGYVFYGYWDPRFCILMAFSTTVSYLAGLGMLRYSTPRARRMCLVIPITVDLALLGFFKYADLILSTARSTLGVAGFDVTVPVLNIILPVGISFYTFHTITYIVDSYRGVIRPTRSIFEFSAYVSLFSQLVAGPIVRFRQIEKDLESLGEAQRKKWLAVGVSFFVVGLAEKVLVADQLAAFADVAWSRWESLGTLGAWLAVAGYTFQLYFDFCGYSDMAVGLGYLFGLRIPQNFNSPYKSRDPSDFWGRWHISLSTCLRDYLYIPMGGNRHGDGRTYRNLMITMLLGGLWHGANWTFVLWGGYHGLLLILYRRWKEEWDRIPGTLRWVLMLLLVSLGWVLFRAEDIGVAHRLLHVMFIPTHGEIGAALFPFVIFLAFAGIWALFGPNAFEMHTEYQWKRRYGFALAGLLGICIALMASGRNSPFLYFQF
jgi:alginate O-acetyltransferase complex protein AlgI